VPNFDLQLQTYASRIRALSIVWFIYGGLILLTGAAGLFFANHYLHGDFGPWAHGPWVHGPWGEHGPFGPGFAGAIIRLGWAFTLVRAALAFIAGWGLMERSQWGRVVAIAAAIFSILKFPIGTAIGIWTLVSLLGYRNTTLYDQLDIPGAAFGTGQAPGSGTPGPGPRPI
jgi:hypothetical protein